MPDPIAMNWRPFTAYAVGALLMPPPVLNDQSRSPVVASSAHASPSGSPPNSRSPPVARRHDRFMYFVQYVHAFFPVTGSKASMCGLAVADGCRTLPPLAIQRSPSLTSCRFGATVSQNSNAVL